MEDVSKLKIFEPTARNLFYFVAITTLIAIVMSAILGLTDQEAYYWTWSRVLDWGYFEHPPLQAWVTRFLTSLFGNTAWAIRMPAYAGRALGLYYYYQWCRLRFGDKTAIVSSFVLLTTFFCISGSVIALPDALVFPFITLALYNSEKRNVVASGMTMGLAVLSKWPACLMIPGLLFSFVEGTDAWSKKIRNVFICGILVLLFQFPPVYWNFAHDWISIKFHLVERHDPFDWNLAALTKNTLFFLGSQLLLGGIMFAVLVCCFLKSRAWKNFSAVKRPSSLLIYILPSFLIFGFSAIRGELRFYWTWIAFLPLIPMLVHMFAHKVPHSSARYAFLAKSSVLISMVTYLLIMIVIFFPVGAYFRPIIEVFNHYDLRQSPRGDIEGWREFAQYLQESGIHTSDYALMGSNFRISSQMAWATDTTDMNKIYVAEVRKNQYEFWETLRNRVEDQAIFFGDNRYNNPEYFNGYCKSDPQWQTFLYKLRGVVVKEIHWAICPQFNYQIPTAKPTVAR